MPSCNSYSGREMRKRRMHKKSRKGCGNCKLRRVKCDETQPRCKKCAAYGVTCSYAPTSAAAALSVEVAFKIDLSAPAQAKAAAAPRVRAVRLAPPHHSLLRHVPPPLPCTGSIDDPDTMYRLTPSDVRLLERFQKRTVLSLGSPTSRSIYERKTLPIAFSHPFVMHTVLAVTHLHDMASAAAPPPEQHAAFAYHWYRGTSLLYRKLCRPIVAGERDALWLAAAFVGIAAFANVADVAAPSCAWPLRPASASDLDWLKLGDGKRQVWRLTDPLRPRGVFRDAANELYAHLLRPVAPAPDGRELGRRLPDGFAELYGLVGGDLAPAENPYWTAAEALAASREAAAAAVADPASRAAAVVPFLGFVSRMDPRFRALLEAKDERAMLMLAYWFAGLCDRRQWWMWRRAALETRAICTYLGRSWEGRREARLLESPRITAERCEFLV